MTLHSIWKTNVRANREHIKKRDEREIILKKQETKQFSKNVGFHLLLGVLGSSDWGHSRSWNTWNLTCHRWTQGRFSGSPHSPAPRPIGTQHPVTKRFCIIQTDCSGSTESSKVSNFKRRLVPYLSGVHFINYRYIFMSN